MIYKSRYSVVRSKYKRQRMKKLILRTAIIFNVSLSGVSMLYVFGNHLSKSILKNNKMVNMVEFNDEFNYLDIDKIENKNLVTQLEEYEMSGYGNDYNAIATLEDAYSDEDNNEVYFDDTIKEKQVFNFEQQVILKYCAIYQVDFNTVYNKLAELTNNFSSEDYLNGTIPNINFKKEPIHFENKETLLAMAVRCCAQTPSVVGLDSSIKKSSTFESSLNIFQMITDYSRLFGLEREEVYSIIRAENSFGSSLTDKTNNFGSLRENGSFLKFDNVSQGILEECAEIYKFRVRNNIKENGEAFFVKLQPLYAPTEGVSLEEAKMNSVWIKNTQNSYREVKSMNVFDDETLIERLELDKESYLEYENLDVNVVHQIL